MNNSSYLTVKNITASFNNKPLLNNVSFSIKQGELSCLAGKNGCGKTTLLNIISNLYKDIKDLKITNNIPLVYINDKLISTLKINEFAKKISYMQQTESPSWNMNVKEFILTGRFCYSKNNYTKDDYALVLQNANLLNLTELLDKDIYSLSGGEFQKVRIARSLTQTPQFLLLDEPSSFLDYPYEINLLQILKKIAKEKNIGILITTHNLNNAIPFIDNLIFISSISNKQNNTLTTQQNSEQSKQIILQGTPQKIITEENLKLIYQKELKTFIHPVLNCVQFC